jgi:hypothetical protein
MEVALDPPALAELGVEDPCPRLLELSDPGAKLRLQTLVVERERPGRRHRGDQLRLVGERRVEDHCGDRFSLARDLDERPCVTAGGQPRGPAVGGHVRAGPRAPVDELERRVAERGGDRLADVRSGGLQPTDEVADDVRARVAHAQQAGKERERDRRDRDRAEHGHHVLGRLRCADELQQYE